MKALAKVSILPGMPERHYVGSFAEVTSLTKDRVESRVFRWWDDEIGELIQAEPVDWAKWRAERRPSPLAPPPGLSKLKAEMWAKKQRKALRAAA
jgi:hypothetical protein